LYREIKEVWFPWTAVGRCDAGLLNLKASAVFGHPDQGI
jgi:hypothetical protein